MICVPPIQVVEFPEAKIILCFFVNLDPLIATSYPTLVVILQEKSLPVFGLPIA